LETIQQKQAYTFLQGGGEMGEIIRNYNWSQSSIGAPDQWPQALQISLSNVLNSGFPKFLFWGEELICFYNDAFRPSLGGEGKHPAVGKRAKEVWTEIWDFIGPLIQDVLTKGKPVWFEDQLVPFYRNGSIQEIYWTFSYSLLINDNGEPGGVLVTCMETTESVLGRKQLEDSQSRLHFALKAGHLGSWELDLKTMEFKASDICKEIFGQPLNQPFSYTSLKKVIHPEDVQHQEQAVLHTINTGLDYNIEYRIIWPDNSVRWVNVRGQLQYEQNNEPASMVGVSLDITDRKRSETKLLESEARFRNVIEQAPIAIGLTRGEDFIFDNINPPMLQLINKNQRADVLGKKVVDVLPELQGQAVYEILQEVLKSGEPFHGTEVPVAIANEGILEPRYFDLSYTRIVDASETAFLLHMALDVTEQVLTRRKVEESEAKYRTLFNSMDQGFCIIEIIFDEKSNPVDYRFLEINPVFEKQTGLHDAAGKTIKQLVPQHEKQWFEIYGSIAVTGEPIRFVEQAAALNRWYDVYAFRVGEKGSNKVAVLFTDITDQKNAEEAIKHSEENLRNMILQAPIAMAILKGPSFVVEIANSRMFDLWGRSPEELMHKSIFEGLPEVREQGYEELLTGVYTTGKTFSALGIPVTLPRKEGIETVYINLLYEAFREADSSISGIMVVASDVTEQVQARQKIEEVVEQRTKELAEANDALQQTNKELQRSNQNLEEFAHAASHDLKEPIRKIHFFTNQLKGQLSSHLKESEVRSFNRIENATERMKNLIDDLLLYSHVSHRPNDTELFDLKDIVQRVLEDLELDIEERKAIIHIKELPVVNGYRRQLQQLFQNLISNALKYSKSDVPPEIYITAEPAEKFGRLYNEIQVKDNGIGFEPEYADKIFQMFTRLHGRSEYAGTGVGLSIVKKVVENHNGFINVESEPDKGSTFKIYLPVK
jgi:PAS domain S-box-containing protein